MIKTLKVTQDDIRASAELIAKSSKMIEYICPVAISLNRQMGGKWCVGAGDTFDLHSNRAIIVTRTLSMYLSRHDDGEIVNPREFRLQVIG